MADLYKKVFHIEMFLLQPHFAGLGSFGSLCVAAPQICVAQGLPMMGECSINNNISRRKGAALQN